MPSIGIADKLTLDQVKALIGANTDPVGLNTLFAYQALLAAYVDELEARLTLARAGKLDNLDALISSRAAAATALSNATWTAAKAAFLDAAISSRRKHLTTITGVQSVSSTSEVQLLNYTGKGLLLTSFGTATSQAYMSYWRYVIDGVNYAEKSATLGSNMQELSLGGLIPTNAAYPIEFNTSCTLYGRIDAGTVATYRWLLGIE